MTPSEIGERAEAAIAAAISRTGRRILLPFGPQRFDLAYEDSGRLVKVQCKSGREYRGVIAFHTASKIGDTYRDYREDVDLFGVYCHTRNEVYLIPVQDVPKRGAHLRVKPPRNAQKARIREASHYLVRDGRLPDRVLHLLTPAGSTPDRTLGNGPSELTSSPQLVLESISIDGRLQSTDVDVGANMPIPVLLAEDRLPLACCSSLAAPKLDEASAEATAALFKALGDPHRVRIVNLLANQDEPVCVCDITAYLGLAQSTVSFHLKKLVNAGLLHREQRGTWAYYSINSHAMQTLREVVEPKGISV